MPHKPYTYHMGWLVSFCFISLLRLMVFPSMATTPAIFDATAPVHRKKSIMKLIWFQHLKYPAYSIMRRDISRKFQECSQPLFFRTCSIRYLIPGIHTTGDCEYGNHNDIKKLMSLVVWGSRIRNFLHTSD